MDELKQIVKKETWRTLFWSVISVGLAVIIGNLVL